MVDAKRMDLGGMATMAGMGWSFYKRADDKTALHLGHYDGNLSRLRGLVLGYAPGV